MMTIPKSESILICYISKREIVHTAKIETMHSGTLAVYYSSNKYEVMKHMNYHI